VHSIESRGRIVPYFVYRAAGRESGAAFALQGDRGIGVAAQPDSRSGVDEWASVATQLFRDDAPITDWLRPLPNKNREILVSIPELALLELASDLGKEGWKGQTLEEAVHLADLMRNLRVDVLTPILGHCVRVKVLELVRDQGQSSGHSWGNDLQAYVEKRSSGKRWSRSGKDGRRLTLKP